MARAPCKYWKILCKCYVKLIFNPLFSHYFPLFFYYFLIIFQYFSIIFPFFSIIYPLFSITFPLFFYYFPLFSIIFSLFFHNIPLLFSLSFYAQLKEPFPIFRDRTRGGEGERRGRDKSMSRNSREYIPRELTSESEQDVSRYSSANSKNTENNYRSTSIISLK